MSHQTLLIVEDEAIVAADLVEILTQLDYSVLAVTDRGDEAITLALTYKPDLVLMDIHLQGTIDGITAAEQIRSRCDCPVVFLTAHSDSATLKRAKITEPFGYILKPFEERELRIVVEIALHKYQMERQLRQSEQRYRSLFDYNLDTIFSLDIQGRFVSANPAAERLSGYTMEELKSRHFIELCPPELREEAKANFRQGLCRQCRDFESALICKDGTQRLLFITGAPVIVDEEVVGVACLARDITERKAAERALYESEQAFRSLAEVMPQMVWATRPDGWNIYFNQQWVDYTGLTHEESAGHNWIKPFHPDDQQRAWDAWQKAVQLNETYSLEGRLRRFDGVYRWWLIRAAPMRGAGGAILKWFGTCTDIEDAKRAEAALQKSEADYRSLFEMAGIGNKEIDVPSGRFLRVNRQYCELVGYSKEELLDGMTFLDLIPPEDRKVDQTVIQTYMPDQTKPSQLEKRCLRKDGTVIWVHLSSSLIRDSDLRPVRLLSSAHDITNRKNIEMALKEASRHKDEFLAMLGHELRNPLTPISLVAQVMTAKPLDENTHLWACDVLNRNLTHIIRLVDDLLDVSRITRGLITLKCQRVELAPLIQECYQTIEELTKTKHQRVDFKWPSEPVYVKGDPVRLNQIIINLLHNATKYTPEGGHIEVRLSEENQSVNLCIQDNGIGMSAALVPKVFNLFVQAEQAPDRAAGGLGIGLTLVKKLVELHGGQIFANSLGLNQGSEFKIQLPRYVERPTETEPVSWQNLTQQPSNNFRMLLIDDNPDILASLTFLLRQAGYSVETAADGLTGCSIAKSLKPDVIVLDIGLPGMDGYMIARQLRQELKDHQPLILALSGYAQTENMRAVEAGFDHYLTKPLNISQLQTLISNRVLINKR